MNNFAQHEDPYLHWERHLRPVEKGARWVNPALVKLRPKKCQSWADAIAQLEDGVKPQDFSNPKWFIDMHELALLKFSVMVLGNPDELRLVLYLPETLEDPKLPNWFTEIKRGPPIRLKIATQRRSGFLGLLKRTGYKSTSGAGKMLGVIDDGIAFLNDRFQTKERATRFYGVWLQSFNQKNAQDNTVFSGKQLSEADINQKLGSKNEISEYQALNNKLFAPTDVKTTNLRVSHGTHVLDIAAGEACDNVVELTTGIHNAPRILGVQLPPASVLDTSGKRMEMNALQGLRWLEFMALHYANEAQLDLVHLVVNLSLGAAADAKNGASFFEEAIRHEIEHFKTLTTAAGYEGSRLEVVMAFGNAYRDSLVAKKDLAKDDACEVDWVLQPDDRTASYLEIRCSKHALIQITAKSPCKRKPKKFGALKVFQYQDTDQLRLYRAQDEGEKAVFVLAAPPSRYLGESSRPMQLRPNKVTPGPWALTVSAPKGATQVSLQVQRDDTPMNYRPHGRQSYIDHSLARNFDPETRNFELPGGGGPVTREGSHSSTATVKGSQQSKGRCNRCRRYLLPNGR